MATMVTMAVPQRSARPNAAAAPRATSRTLPQRGIEGFHESLAVEVEPFGIRTTLVEPGMIRSTFYEAAGRVPVSPPYRRTPASPPLARRFPERRQLRPQVADRRGRPAESRAIVRLAEG